MFWDSWDYRDIQICGIFVALGIILLWNLILTYYILTLRKISSRNLTSEDITTTRIASSSAWNQMYVPKIPRLQKMNSKPTTISSIPQTPSEWFGDGPDQMNDNIFF